MAPVGSCSCTEEIIITIRNVQRVIHVPFYTPVIASSDGEQLILEERMSITRQNASAAIGHIIRMKKPLLSHVQEMREHIGQSLLPFVSANLPGVYFRVKKCYALVLAAGRLHD